MEGRLEPLEVVVESSRMVFSIPATAPDTAHRRKKFSPAWIEPSAMAARLSGSRSDLMPFDHHAVDDRLGDERDRDLGVTARIAAMIIRNRPR